MGFYSRVAQPPTVAQTFDKVVDEYGWVYDEVSKRQVPGVKGKLDIYAKIQAATPGCTLNDLIENYQKGSMSAEALMAVVGQQFGVDSSKIYADVSELPQDIFELDAMRVRARNAYDALPADVKALFDSDYQTFAQAVVDGSYQKKFQEYEASKKPATQRQAEAAVQQPSPNVSVERPAGASIEVS